MQNIEIPFPLTNTTYTTYLFSQTESELLVGFTDAKFHSRKVITRWWINAKKDENEGAFHFSAWVIFKLGDMNSKRPFLDYLDDHQIELFTATAKESLNNQASLKFTKDGLMAFVNLMSRCNEMPVEDVNKIAEFCANIR